MISGKPGDLGDTGDGQPGLLQELGGAARGDHFDPHVGQTPDKRLEILLIGYRNQSSRDFHSLLPLRCRSLSRLLSLRYQLLSLPGPPGFPEAAA